MRCGSLQSACNWVRQSPQAVPAGARGTLAGAWGAHIPSIKHHLALDEVQLALVLLAAGLGAVAALLVAGRVVAGLGVRRTVQAAGLLVALALGCFLHLPGLAHPPGDLLTGGVGVVSQGGVQVG